MAKTKYKLGTFVKTFETEDLNAHHGAVEEIHLTPAGTSYKLSGLEEAVTEEAIEQGYRAIVPRAASKPRTAKGGKRKSRAEASASASA